MRKMANKLGEKCAVFGIYAPQLDVSRLTFFGLFALQHRGQESSGIAASNGQRIASHRGMGLVAQVYTEEVISTLSGHMALGHNRYSTSKTSSLEHAQPIVVNQELALAHNGNLPSTKALEDFLSVRGIEVSGKSDSSLMAAALSAIMAEGKSLEEAVKKAFPLFTGAFSLVLMSKDTLVAVRDSFGIRPLALGKIDGGFAVASETCAFKTIGAKFLQEVQPGSMVVINEQGVREVQLAPPNLKVDIFEFVYFARPDSNILGKSVYSVRQNFGRQLARECKIQADLVIPVPETAYPVAVGYSEISGIPFQMGLIKNRYIHRTFIEPDQHTRDLGVRLKLTPLPEVLQGKRIIVMDDSIVRGTTSRQLVKELFDAGAKEVHFLVSSPPVRFPDFYGIDTPKQKNLIAAQKSVAEIKEFLGATSLYYLSYAGMIKATGLPESVFCTSCFTGIYPLDIQERALEVQFPQAAAPAQAVLQAR